MENIALWMSQPHFSYLEIARTCGFSSFVLELEHGTFDLSTLDQFLAFTKAHGLSTLTKVLAPTPEAIQQALDFGSDGVIVPHILGVEHARQVTRAAKYPLTGTRSYTGGRIFGYARPATDAFEKENKRTKCFALIESGGKPCRRREDHCARYDRRLVSRPFGSGACAWSGSLCFQ
jgi:4-hydroxy-2-oxoheptanedioate aldolase